jgi:hypothetical protein
MANKSYATICDKGIGIMHPSKFPGVCYRNIGENNQKLAPRVFISSSLCVNHLFVSPA